MANSNTIFTGTSTYTSDFQQIIDRSVAIASLPLTQLNNQKTHLTDQSSALSTLSSKFSALHSALDNLNNATGASSFSANLSDPSIAKVHIGATEFTGDVNLEVISLGARTNTLSLDSLTKVSDPFTENVTVATNLTLTVDGTTYNIVPASGTLSSLAQAINSSGAGLHASIVNLGTTATPDYRLSLQSNTLADVDIQLNDGSVDLLSTLSSGSPATYRINGQPTSPIESDSRTITISPGLTVDLLDTGITDISVSRTSASISNALSSFVGAYNDAVSGLDANRGGSGALSGQSLVYTLAQTLRHLTSYTGSGDISSIANLGLEFNKEGKLTFDTTTFSNAATDVDSILTFLGATGGSGFLQAAGNILDSIDTGGSGLLTNAIDSVNSQIIDQNKRIDDTQVRIDLLRERLTAKITAADAAIAQLQQQAIFFQGLFDAYNKANSKS